MAHRLLLSLLILTSLTWADTFDNPVRRQTVDLGPSPSGPATTAKVKCYFFPEFMVKEVDMGEVGAERLGILPVTPSSSGKCVKAADAEEKVIRSDDWSGYFMGVRKNYVFFGAADRINSSLPFAVFDAGTGKTLWEYGLGQVAYASPMTYRSRGRQILVIATGGGTTSKLVAFALPTN